MDKARCIYIFEVSYWQELSCLDKQQQLSNEMESNPDKQTDNTDKDMFET